MPENRQGHAATSAQPSQPSEMETGRGLNPIGQLLDEIPLSPKHPKIFSTSEVSRGVESSPEKRKHVDKKSLDYMIRSGIAGGLAGCAAKTIVAPLDRVKILFQASSPQFAKYTGSWFGVATAMKDIYSADGLSGLFRGHSATLLRVFPYAGIKFLAYEQIRHAFIPSKVQESHTRRFLSGSLAGITSVFFTYPLEVVRVRMAFETKRDSRSSLTQICRQIYHEQPPQRQALAAHGPVAAVQAVPRTVAPHSGLINFYRGFAPTIMGMIPYAGMSFLTHDFFGDLFRHPSIANYTVIPKTRAEESIDPSEKQPYRRPQLTAPAELTSGALAGLISQTASYPLEVIRRRMQVGGAIGDGHRMSIAETTRKIWVERGLRGFFVGLTIGYVKVIPLAATSFYVYERMKWAFDIHA